MHGLTNLKKMEVTAVPTMIIKNKLEKDVSEAQGNDKQNQTLFCLLL